MKTEMKVLLYIKRSGQDKDGRSPLMGRIAVRGKNNSIAQFSCKFKVDVRLWNATAQRCTGKSRMAVMANREIERTLLLLRQRFNELEGHQGSRFGRGSEERLPRAGGISGHHHEAV